MLDSSNFKLVLAAAAVIISLYACMQKLQAGHAPRLPGAVVVGEPEQDEGRRKAAFQYKGHQIEPFASFTVRARLLSAERYRFDREAQLAPIDFALGWNDMSNDAVLDRLRISQGNRWYMYQWDERGPPVPPEVIIRNSANMHLIPADEEVLQRLERVRPGAVVTLHGWLVDAQASDGRTWRSSRSRTDSGQGACELVWVEDVQVGGSD